jgi:hypothetical protein
MFVIIIIIIGYMRITDKELRLMTVEAPTTSSAKVHDSDKTVHPLIDQKVVRAPQGT